jgi:4a-hydroxytetrahydrobiopterin dehydratase
MAAVLTSEPTPSNLQIGRLYKASIKLQCRTKCSLAMHHCSPPGSSLALLLLVRPAILKKLCTSDARLNTAAKQLTPKREPDGIIFAPGQPADLPDRLSNLPSAWQLTASKKGIVRQYSFSSFSKAWMFMSAVAEECKAKKHHPFWSNTYNQVTVEWTTHKPEGLSIKDIEMADFCDRTANGIGLKN